MFQTKPEKCITFATFESIKKINYIKICTQKLQKKKSILERKNKKKNKMSAWEHLCILIVAIIKLWIAKKLKGRLY